MSRTEPSPSSEHEIPAKRAEPLVIQRLAFLGGQASPEGWRPSSLLPEIAFSGRSNVGKSSLLNALVRRKSLARVSQQPGKTREINFFSVNDALVLVDLPGYGYARVSREERAKWRPLIESYLERSAQLRGIVQLLDVRRDPSDDDRQMLEFIAELGVPTIVVLTKVDKVSVSEAVKRVIHITSTLGLEAEQVIPFSTVTRRGRDELAAAIESLLAAGPWREA
jgi:GTP-binding protein